MATPVTVVGAGPAGLATAACLTRRGVPAVVVDRGSRVGESWARRYERLRLHTPRIQSHLPGYRIPASAGRWVARDEFVAYLERYARHHGIRPRFGIEVRRIDRDGARWVLDTSDGRWRTETVVLATGYNNVPYLPAWEGGDDFPGTLVHASDYRAAGPYLGRDVLVVGAGNTAAEIATDLAEQAGGPVWLSVRTPPQVVPRTIAGVPVTLLGIVDEHLPAAVGDPVNRVLQRWSVGDLTRYGMPRVTEGLLAQHRRTGALPLIDIGLTAQLRAGRVRPVPAVVGFDGDRVVLADGTRLRVDAVIAATGYRTGLETLVGHLGVLDQRGRPVPVGGCGHLGARNRRAGRGRADRAGRRLADGLYVVGLRNPLTGLLLAIRRDARWVAARIAASGPRG